MDEQRRFHELAASVLTFGQAPERQAGGLADVSRILAGVGSTAPVPPPHPVQQTASEDNTVVSDTLAAVDGSLYV